MNTSTILVVDRWGQGTDVANLHTQFDGLTFGLLGPVRAEGQGRCWAPTAPRPRAVLALLLLHANRHLPMARIVELLWADRPPARADATVQVYVGGIRRALAAGVDVPKEGHILRTEPAGYRLVVSAYQLDLVRFRELSSAAERAARDCCFADASDLFQEALDLWRGPALAELTRIGLLARAAAGLEAERIAALRQRAEADLCLGRYSQVADQLGTLCDCQPFDENLHHRLMVVLWRIGRRADALQVFLRMRSRLVECLGIEPAQQLQRLHRAILLGREPPPGPHRHVGPLLMRGR